MIADGGRTFPFPPDVTEFAREVLPNAVRAVMVVSIPLVTLEPASDWAEGGRDGIGVVKAADSRLAWEVTVDVLPAVPVRFIFLLS